MANDKELRKKVLQLHYDISNGDVITPIEISDIAKKLGLEERDHDLKNAVAYLTSERYLRAFSIGSVCVTPLGVREVEGHFLTLAPRSKQINWGKWGAIAGIVAIPIAIIGIFLVPKSIDNKSVSVVGSIITERQSGGDNTIINNPPTLRAEEDFVASSLKNDFTATTSGEILHIELKQYPMPGSVETWWGAMSLTPSDFQVIGKDVQVDFLEDQAAGIKKVVPGSSDDSNMSFVVTYIPDPSRLAPN